MKKPAARFGCGWLQVRAEYILSIVGAARLVLACKMRHDILDHAHTGIMAKRHDGFGMELNGCHRFMFMFKSHDDPVFRFGCDEKIIRQAFRIGKIE
ncbi:hypothetical protein DK52_984 [Brucella abortus]|nr:hypothetical protein DK52_984 [Brucella abortus]